MTTAFPVMMAIPVGVAFPMGAARVVAVVGASPFPAVGMAVQVRHVVVVVLVGIVEHHVEVAGIQAVLRHARHAHREPLHRQAVEGCAHRCLVGSRIEQRRDQHVAADARAAFQV